MEPASFGVFYTNCMEDQRFFWILLLNCAIAYLVNLTNFLVTKCTSPLTLQVRGTFTHLSHQPVCQPTNSPSNSPINARAR